MRRTRLLFAVLVLTGLVAAPAGAATKRYSVPKLFETLLPKVKARTVAPVLLPSSALIDRRGRKIVATGGGRSDGYDFELALGRHCRGANACTLASFVAERGGELPGRVNATLAGGVRGHYRPLSCGASCASPSISWVRNDVLYYLAFKGYPRKRERAGLIALANSSLRAGPR